MNRQDLLSEDERLVLRLLGKGCAPAEITRWLAHQPLALPSVCQSIVLKLGLSSEAELRSYAESLAAQNN